MSAPDRRVVGSRVPRTEDAHLVTGRGRFVDGIRLPDQQACLHAAFVRSPMPHALLTSVDLEGVRGQAGVVAAFSGEDLDLEPLPAVSDAYDPRMRRPLLARDRVRFAGEPLAVVVAGRREEAVDALEFADVGYEVLDAVVSPQHAAADGVLLYPEVGTNTVRTTGEPAGDEAFAGCEVVVRQHILNQRLAPCPMEPRAALAAVVDGTLTAWLPTQTPHRARDEVAGVLGLDHDAVRVVAPDVGGAFGARIGVYPEEIVVAWLAWHLGRAVRWVETRGESMLGLGHGRAQHQTVTIGGRRDGTIEAYRLEMLQDAGAYPHWGASLPNGTGSMAPGVYAIGHVECTSRSVVTNTTPTVAYRGAGRPEATAAIERAVDLFAAEIGMDPAEVRRRNLVPDGAFPWTSATGTTYDSGAYGAALEHLLAEAGYAALRQEQQRRRSAPAVRQLGVGLSMYVEVTAGYRVAETARVAVHPDGTVDAYTGTFPQGQGHATSWAMLVSDTMGVPLDRIRVRYGDTSMLAKGDGTYGSRSLQIGGVAIQAAAEEAVAAGRRLAAEQLESAVVDIVLDRETGRFQVRGDPSAGLGWGEVAALAGSPEGLVAVAEYDASAATFPFGAHLAVVEVDTETGVVDLVRFVALDDAGRLVNPLLAEGQRHGGIVQGIGQALFEEFSYDADGNPLTSTFADYTLPAAADLPSLDLLTTETPTPVNALGVKGIGEAGAIGAPPAVQNAVVDALSHLGVRHVDMPLTPHQVWLALHPMRIGTTRTSSAR